ncbi:MAG: hypothetical protein M1334_02730 [Patescibacteria group bacterium]|nr:hypothetical protein [Patescibacteria group bacterium]
MNITSILALLQIALVLLSNPNVATNPTLKAQALSVANQAIVLASNELAQEANQPPQSTPTTSDLGMASEPTTTPTTTPESCELSGLIVKHDYSRFPYYSETDPMENRSISFTWTLQGMDANTTGTLYQELPMSNEWSLNQHSTDTLSSATENQSLFDFDFKFKAIFDNAVCYAYFHAVNGNFPDFGTKSTPTK